MTEAAQTLAASYLLQLHALASEMNVAMDAIAANALPELEASVARQEMLSTRLAAMAANVGYGSNTSLDSATALEIHAARSAIRTLNLQYAALLKRSGRTIAQLSALCKTHTGESQEARGPRLKHQTWSCEM